MSIGFAIGSIVAFAIGLTIALNQGLDRLISSSLNFLRSIPSVVFLPLLVASIGASMRTAIFLTALVVSLKLVIYVSRGVLETEKEHIEFAKLYRLNTLSRIYSIYLPSLISVVSTGFRLTASRAFGTVIASGIIIGTPGIGKDLLYAGANAEYERVFSYVIVMGVIGTLLYSLFNVIERRFIRWRVVL
jgi:ABC-type nitrate/sulfonate/bicarbonate transport system permease component